MSNTYNLGDSIVKIYGTGNDKLVLIDLDKDEYHINDVQPHELRKLATVLEEAKRAKDFPEDHDYIT